MLLSDSDRSSLERRLSSSLRDDVTILVFVMEGVSASNNLVDLARTIASASPKIKVEVEKVIDGKNQRMKDLKIENVPVVVLVRGDFSRIRYYGIPSGYEMPPLVDAIVELSNSATPLSPNAKSTLSTVRRKANIKVFVLTTCTFCPTVARHAYRAAIESEKVTAEVIDSQLFPDLAARHSVMGVPKIILNDNTDITGAMQEADFFQKLKDSDIAQIDSMFG
jgi:glutaredoxin-like protein